MVPEPPEFQEEGNPDLDIVFIGTITDVGNTYPLESFQVMASVLNKGDEPSVATTLRIYRSVDTTVDTSDTQVGSASVTELAASEHASTDDTCEVAVVSGKLLLLRVCGRGGGGVRYDQQLRRIHAGPPWCLGGNRIWWCKRLASIPPSRPPGRRSP